MNTTLLVDGSNNFIRNYVTFPSTTKNGTPYGGVVGFLRSLGNFVQLTKPTRVIVAFDAAGGSQRRRKINKDYKQGRKPSRLNRHFEIGDNAEDKNKEYQEFCLQEYLETLPVHVVRIDNIEADDVIGFLCGYYNEDRKIICSNDKDFYQLLDNQTVMYKPSLKTFYTQRECHQDFNVHPINFALARAVIGDPSDNIKGVPGIGFKTLVKYAPMFSDPAKIEIEGLLDWCASQKGKKYNLLVESENIIRDNYSIMTLTDPLISLRSMSMIKENVQQRRSMNNTALRGKLIRDGIDIGNNFFQSFLTLSLAGKLKNV